MRTRQTRTCLLASYEEADHILVQQYQGDKVRIISDDTYVLVLLPHVYVYDRYTRALHMSSPVAHRSIMELGATLQKNNDTPTAILVIHALGEADTVLATYNVDKQLTRKAMEQPTQTICRGS